MRTVTAQEVRDEADAIRIDHGERLVGFGNDLRVVVVLQGFDAQDQVEVRDVHRSESRKTALTRLDVVVFRQETYRFIRGLRMLFLGKRDNCGAPQLRAPIDG